MSTCPTAVERCVVREPYRIRAHDYPGHEPTIVLMHGFPDDHHLYDRLLPHLVGHRRVVTFDFLGWGESDKPAGYPYTSTNQTADLSAVIEELRLDQVMLVAHDASGPPAIDWALEHPERVATLVLLNTYYGWMPRLRSPEAITLYSTPILRNLARPVMRRFPELDRRLYFWQVGRFINDDGIRRELLPEYYDRFRSTREAFWRLNADLPRTLISRARRTDDLRAFRRPVRVVFGADDPYLNRHVARRFATLFPAAELQLIDGARHYVQVDEPDQVAAVLLGPALGGEQRPTHFDSALSEKTCAGSELVVSASPTLLSKRNVMSALTSKDGTNIVFDQVGEGPSVVIVGGVIGDRSQQTPVAQLLGDQFTVYNYDRRGHGESGFTEPYSTDREAEDLAAVIDQAGGSASVYATSGCSVIALQAAANGAGITRLALWEPPFIVDDSRPSVPTDYREQLEALLEQERRGDMVALFLTEAAGIPAPFVEQLRQAPFWGAQEAFAHTLVYDATMMRDYSIPASAESVRVPTLVLDGGTTPWLTASADKLASVLPDARRQSLPGQQHNVEPDAIAPALSGFFRG